MRTFYLVYQSGLANVFENSGLGKVRVLQDAFHVCEDFCRGCAYMGANINVRHCDEPGDITGRDWKMGPGTVYAKSKNPRMPKIPR